MHGSSAVPQDWLAIINEYGGQIPETYGVPVEQVVEGIKHGVRKVNIDTDLRLASTGAIRRFLRRILLSSTRGSTSRRVSLRCAIFALPDTRPSAVPGMHQNKAAVLG